MQKLYFIARIAAYVSGLAGLIFFSLGRHGANASPRMTAVGASLIGISFVCFLVTYVVYTFSKFTSRPK